MEPFNQSDVDTARNRPQQPPDFGRPVAAEGPEHGEGMGGGVALRTPAAPAPAYQANERLAKGDHLDDRGVAKPRTSAGDADRLGALGIGPGEHGAGLASEISAGLKRRKRSRRLRPAVADDGSVNPGAIMLLVERQKFRCALSGRALNPDNAALDHIIPICRGGEHCIGNTQVLDRTVNRAKGTMTNEEFIALCIEVWRHAHAQHHGKHTCTTHE